MSWLVIQPASITTIMENNAMGVRFLCRLYLPICLMLMLSPFPIVAARANSVSSAERFLAGFISGEIEGDGMQRRGKVFDNSPHTSLGHAPQSIDGHDCDCSYPKDVFSVDSDPVVVVTNWRILGTRRLNAEEITVMVLFHVVARSTGDGDGTNPRRIFALIPPFDESINYTIRDQDEHPVLVDPPLPRVGLMAMIKYVSASADEINRSIELGKPEHYPAVERVYQRLCNELKVLREIESARS